MNVVQKGRIQRGILGSTLERVVSDTFPGIKLSRDADFWPVPSLNDGELSSCAAIEIARATKQNAKQVADTIIASLAQSVAAEWRNDRGYIVCSALPLEALLGEVDSSVCDAIARLSEASPSADRAIWCLIPDNTSPSYARIRVVARAAMQVFLSVAYTGVCDVCFYPCAARRVRCRSDVLGVFQEAVEWILSHESEERLHVELPLIGNYVPGVRTFVWTTHHYHDRLAPELRHQLATARSQGTMCPIMPADGWLLSRDRALSEILSSGSLSGTVQKLVTPDLWKRFLFHAGGRVPSGDFDPAVALFDEWASPLWSLHTLSERFKRFQGVWELPVRRESILELIDVVPEPRELIVASLLMSSFTARAIQRGEMAAWSEALERMTRQGHLFINSPQTRAAIQEGSLDSNSGKIAAGLGFGISCILPLIAEDTCGDRQRKVGVT